ncbi:MAG: hypothetical protein OEZ06_25985 [Myxococcales bacterium]|nr:hypothetical protein [Myxococcales bacterium]
MLLALWSCGDDDADAAGGRGNPAGVGNHCDHDDDCQTGECYIGPGGGYCTSPCASEGDVSDCPADTVCKPIQGGARRCLLICGSDSACDFDDCAQDYCPSGSSCVGVDNTEHRACEPNP